MLASIYFLFCFSRADFSSILLAGEIVPYDFLLGDNGWDLVRLEEMD